jgi:hypothetical protein
MMKVLYVRPVYQQGSESLGCTRSVLVRSSVDQTVRQTWLSDEPS